MTVAARSLGGVEGRGEGRGSPARLRPAGRVRAQRASDVQLLDAFAAATAAPVSAAAAFAAAAPSRAAAAIGSSRRQGGGAHAALRRKRSRAISSSCSPSRRPASRSCSARWRSLRRSRISRSRAALAELGVAVGDVGLVALELAHAHRALRLDVLDERLACEQLGGADGGRCPPLAGARRWSVSTCSRCSSTRRRRSSLPARWERARASSCGRGAPCAGAGRGRARGESGTRERCSWPRNRTGARGS